MKKHTQCHDHAKRFLVVAIVTVAVLASTVVVAQIGSNNPTDQQIGTMRFNEGGASATPTHNEGVFFITDPPAGTTFQPVKRVPRDKFGVVGHFPLQKKDLDGLAYPDATDAEKDAILEGMQFFTAPHAGSEGAGPMANQPFCLGCHMSQLDTVPERGVVSASTCPAPGSTCVSIVSRASRSTPTNFKFTSLDPATGGGRAPGTLLPFPNGEPNPADNLDAVHGPGRTAAFTVFGDFDPNHTDAPPTINPIGFFDPLDGASHNFWTGPVFVPRTSQPFGGFVQHVRPSSDIPSCVAKPIPPVAFDTNLTDPNNCKPGMSCFRRSVGERAGPPYIGRGLMEAIPNSDLQSMADPNDTKGSNSSLGHFAATMGCTGDCIAGKANMIPRTMDPMPRADGSVRGFVGGLGRFGLRANGSEIVQFITGGLQGELSFTGAINPAEINFPTLFPGGTPSPDHVNGGEPQSCRDAAHSNVYPASSPSNPPVNEAHLSTSISERNFIRNIAPPEFGDGLLKVLNAPNTAFNKGESKFAQIKRGAELFGIDVAAFANRMIEGRMPAGGDGRDPNAINQANRQLNCVGCHIPVQRTGLSPASKDVGTPNPNVGGNHLTYKWAPIFSDLLLHKMPVIDAERLSARPRDPVLVARLQGERGDDGEDGDNDRDGGIFNTFDLSRNLIDDAFSSAKASADGREFRTAPLMGLGRMGAPLLHDARVYLSRLTVNTTPAGTVTTNNQVTNAPLVVRSLGDAIRAAIELHDLPAPDDNKTSNQTGGGCPVPNSSNIDYGPSPASVICPAYNSPDGNAHRSDAREVIRRFRSLSPQEQQALIEFLKQL